MAVLFWQSALANIHQDLLSFGRIQLVADFYSPTLKVDGDINVGSGEEERAADWARVY